VDWWRIAHILSLVWLGAGLGSTYPHILHAWASNELRYQAFSIVEAANNESRHLLPGAMATGSTGFFWAVADERNFFTEAWLAILSALFVFFYLVCLPLLAVGLRRAREAVLAAEESGELTDELKEVLEDKVPIVFGALLILSVPLMAWVAIFKPF